MKNWCLIFLFVFLWVCNSVAQSTLVPDTNFRKFLQKNHPSVMNVNGYLIDSLAARYTGIIDCSNANISSVSGIQKFIRLSGLTCYRNNIASLDSIRNLVQLGSLHCGYNPITTLPSLSKLTKLAYLTAGFCQLTSLPDLSRNIALTQIDCYNNKLTTIPGISKLVNLMYLNCYGNQLTSLEDLSACTRLSTLQCFNNLLPSLPGLSELAQLKKLVAGNNLITFLPPLDKLTQLEELIVWTNKIISLPELSSLSKLTILSIEQNSMQSLPDLSNNTNLKLLKCKDNLLTTLPDISTLSFLEYVNLSNNKLVKVPDLSASIGTLQELDLDHNLISDLPNIVSYKNLSTLRLENNNLSFEDLLPLTTGASFSTFTYSPQNTSPEKLQKKLNERDNYLITSTIDMGVPNLSYSWYKNGVLLPLITNDRLDITSATLSDAGLYSAFTSHASLPNLTLPIITADITVQECITLKRVQPLVTPFECNLGSSLSIDETTIAGGAPPFNITLSSRQTGKQLLPQGNRFYKLYEPYYTLSVTDVNGCTASMEIQVEVINVQDCDKRVIVVGNQDSNLLYLEDAGTAKIYEKNGKLVKTLTTPANWDGSNFNNEIIPGFYLIEINDKRYPVTVIR